MTPWSFLEPQPLETADDKAVREACLLYVHRVKRRAPPVLIEDAARTFQRVINPPPPPPPPPPWYADIIRGASWTCTGIAVFVAAAVAYGAAANPRKLDSPVKPAIGVSPMRKLLTISALALSALALMSLHASKADKAVSVIVNPQAVWPNVVVHGRTGPWVDCKGTQLCSGTHPRFADPAKLTEAERARVPICLPLPVSMQADCMGWTPAGKAHLEGVRIYERATGRR